VAPGKRLFLLDGHSLAYRAYFALPTTLATSTGQVTNAVFGFSSMLIKLLGEEHPDLIAVAFDVGAPTVRLEMYADYKAGRAETPSEFRPQLRLIEEVLAALKIPVIRVEDHEADDAIGTLAVTAASRGIEAVIVTADRDFFQLVGPRIHVMFNRRGISDIALYDEAAVEARYGIPPAKYLDYVALKGDTSDNIPGVPGVGDKTAAKLVQDFGSVESIVEHLEDLKGKLRQNIEAAKDQLAVNKELARIVTNVQLDVEPEDCLMGEPDRAQIFRVFASLESRSLLDRLDEAIGPGKTALEVAELNLKEVTPKQLATILQGEDPLGVRLHVDDRSVVGIAVSQGEGDASYSSSLGEEVRAYLSDPSRAKWTHDSKELERGAALGGLSVAGVVFDSMLAGYVLDPAAGAYGLERMCEEYLGTGVLDQTEEGTPGQLFADEGWRPVAAEAAAVALVAPVILERVQTQGLDQLLADVELPLSSVLARMEARGVRLDTEYLDEMGDSVRDRMATLKADAYRYAGEEFNLNSPPQLRAILYDKLGLKPGKKTPKGELSTDASVLEKLRDDHPIVDSLLSWRELDKLNSTYLEALPKLVDPRDGRVHTSFNQAVAATGRLSSSNPNLQNIPIRTELGRQIRRAFIPGGSDQVILCADYSQIELRILAHLSADEGLRQAFGSGEDVHTATAARVFGLELKDVKPAIRNRAKMVNYGLAYGMNAWGLSGRLDIPVEEAQEIIDAYFAAFPQIRDYLDKQVARASAEGFTETMLGRRRYIPELQSSNPRLRDLGRRQALNAPIQGSASDVFKVAMIAVDRELLLHPDLDCHPLLTVHDELVLEVPADRVEEAGSLVKARMEDAVKLDVDLRADLGWGPNWAEAAPEGH
jgi:DNA polymerase-1